MVRNKLIGLTPKNRLEENQSVYVEALEFGVEESDIKNIAVTGPYGSGKSTVLNAFISIREEEKKSSKDDILKISITKFQSNSPASKGEALTTEGEEKDLEQQVLQQMIYTVNPEKIPESRFRRVKPYNIKYYREFIARIFIYVLVTFLMFSVFNYGELFQKLIENKEGNWLVIFFFGILWIYGTIWFIIHVFEEFRKNIKDLKLGIKGNSIQIDRNTKDNIFDKYLDEIVYYFKVVGYEIVIFEDLDRFQNIEIYERLRNLNFLLNEAIDDRKITFIYALRDDIFDDLENRDESISENPATQRTKFFDLIIPTIKIISHANSEEVLLKHLGLSREKQDNELDLELIQYISYYINDMRLLINIVNEFEIFKRAINNSAINKSKLFAMVVYKNLFPKDYTELLKMNQEGSLLYRALQNQKSLTAELIDKDPYVSTYSYSQLLNVDLKNQKYKEIEKIFIKEKTDYQLLWYFLKEGWICEHYTDYISYYYDGVIYQEDLEYLKSVGLNQEVEFNVTLRNPQEVLERLKEDRLSKPYIIINDLLEYLNKNSMKLSNKEQKKRAKIGQYIASNIKLFHSRIEPFKPWVNMEEAVVEGLKLIIDNEMADKFFGNESLDNQFIKSTIELILRQFEWEKIQFFDTDYLSKKISESPDFFTWNIEVNDSLFGILQKMNVKFSNIEFESPNQELRKSIINYSLYSLDKEIISFIIDTPTNDPNFNYKRMKEIPELAEQLEQNIHQLVDVLNSNPSYTEEESTFLSLLNLKSISSVNIGVKILNNNGLKFPTYPR